MGRAPFPSGCNLRYGMANSKVGPAAAKVAGETTAKLLGRGIWMFVKERLGRDYISGRAEAALLGVIINIRLLHRVRLLARGQPFGCRDLVALCFDCQRGTRVDRSAIEQHGTRATLATITDALGS